MSKSLKIKLILTLTTGTIIGSILVPKLYNADKKPQNSNIKENYINDITEDFQNTNKIDNIENLNSSSNTKNSNDNLNNNVKKKETTNPNIKKSSNNTKKEVITNPKIDDENSNIIDNNTNTNEETTPSSELKNENNNISDKKESNSNTTVEIKIPTINYDRTTSIYTDDYSTLLRIEYYSNNKLAFYSVIEEYDATTKSYIEKIYQCNRETNIDPLIRTDVYVNGNLTKSY